MNTENIKGMYFGDRGLCFKNFIKNILEKSNLKSKYIDILLSEENMKIFSSAFTSEQVDEINNYQVYEQLGDLTCNKFIVWYIYKRFPQLKCAEGVKIAARLRINLGSKDSFCNIAEKLGFWDFITATNELRQRKKKPLLEDVFEAFLGAVEFILDENFEKVGVGYSCVYKILASIFDELDISLKYEHLYDSKTRLKELFDIYSEKLGPLKYEEKRDDVICHSYIYRLSGAKFDLKVDGTINLNSYTGPFKKILIGMGSAALKADAEQNAATDALKNLARDGFVKYTPQIYSKLATQNSEKEKVDVLKIIGNFSRINELFTVKNKSKYQNKYMSTVVSLCLKKRDLESIEMCLNNGADLTILDTEGMSPLDNLFIGEKKKTVMKIFKLISKKIDKKLPVNKNVYETFIKTYDISEERFTFI